MQSIYVRYGANIIPIPKNWMLIFCFILFCWFTVITTIARIVIKKTLQCDSIQSLSTTPFNVPEKMYNIQHRMDSIQLRSTMLQSKYLIENIL